MALYQNMIGGFKMPSVGLGTYNAFNNEETENSVDAALKIGYRYIDTAHLYKNEAAIGKVLQKWFSSGKLKREEIFITSKLPMEAIHPDLVEQFLKESLEALQVDYIDAYLIHWPICMKEVKTETGGNMKSMDTDHIAVWKKMEEQVDAGRCKTIGLSNFNAKQIEKIWTSARIKPSSLQIELSPILQQWELVEYCQKKGIVVIGFSSLGSQTLIDQWTQMGIYTHAIPKVLDNDVILKIAKKHNKTPAQIIIRYFVQKNVVQIPKSINPIRLKENIDVFNFSLDLDDNKEIESLHMGEEGRLNDPGRQFKDFRQHPEYPFGQQ